MTPSSAACMHFPEGGEAPPQQTTQPALQKQAMLDSNMNPPAWRDQALRLGEPHGGSVRTIARLTSHLLVPLCYPYDR